MILLSAIPGSGKSTWARQYQTEHPNTHIVSSDELRKVHFGAVNNFQHEQELWKLFLEGLNAYDKEEDVTVIADATNLTNAYRRYYKENTPNYDRHILVVFNIPYDICKIQNQMRTRDRVVPDKALESLYQEFEKPDDATIDLFDEVIFVGKSFVSEKVKEMRAD